MRARLIRSAVIAAASLSLAGIAMPFASSIASAEPVTTAGGDLVAETPTVGWSPNSGVHALAQDAQWIYLGGNFTSLTNPTTNAKFAANHLVRLSIATGAPDPTWKPSVNGDVTALAINTTTSTLYVGGEFTTVDGSARVDLGAVSTANSGLLLPWYPGAANGEVRSIVQLDPSTLMFGGTFTKIGSASRSHLAKASVAGALDASFVPKVDGTVYVINHPAGASFVYLGGLFENLGGVSRVYIGALDTTTALPTDWNPGNPCPTSTIVCPVYSFVATPTAIYAAVGGRSPRGSTISYDPTTAARNWTVTSDGDNQAIALVGNELFVGGHFGPSYGGAVRDTLAAVNIADGALEPFAPTVTNDYPGTAALMVLPDGSLVVGGDQDTIGGTKDSKYAVFPASAGPLDQPPVAAFSSNCVTDLCSFDASTSTDADGNVVSYAWSFGDGSTGTGETTSHDYGVTRTDTVTLTVTDDQGGSASSTQTVQAVSTNIPPTSVFTATCPTLTCSFDGTGSGDIDGTIVSYLWFFGDGTYGSGVTTTHTYAAPGPYSAALYVVDNLNASAITSQTVTPIVTITQHITNPSIETGAVTGWVRFNATSAVAAVQPAGGSIDGTWAMRITNTGKKAAVTGAISASPHWVSSTVIGTQYAGSVYISGPAGSKITLLLNECNAASKCAGKASVVVTLPASGWVQAKTSYTAKTNGDAIRFSVSGSVPAKGVLLADLFSLTS